MALAKTTGYDELLKRKTHSSNDHGISVNFMPDSVFDFQEYSARHFIKKGRCAGFLDTGLGKTLIELIIATNYVRHTNKAVLILTPLAVAFQFLEEAVKFGIGDIEYSKDGKYKSKIVVANYERLHYFDFKKFDCVILDESSILKNFDGAIKTDITAFMKKIPYRYLFTATPSPNDFIELGTSSEALGYLGYMDMLTKFFKNNEDTISPMNIGTEWVLKAHAVKDFFRWVSTWSLSCRRPSDLGFSDALHVLPDLFVNYHAIANTTNQIDDNGQMMMFNKIAKRQSDIQKEARQTVKERCEQAFALASQHDTSVYWCNLNPESDLLKQLDKDAYELRGNMLIDEKEEILLAFAKGQIKKLITKPKITAFGLNWQHCSHTTFFPTFSYEQYYQAIRRFWRFGALHAVTADIIHSDGQSRLIDSINVKGKKADELFSKLNSSLNQEFLLDKTEFNQKIILPTWM